MKFLALSICTLGCIASGIGINHINSQISTKFEEIKGDEFVKTKEESSSYPTYGPWSLIYSSGSVSFLRELLAQIRLSSEAGKLVNEVPATNSFGAMMWTSETYLPNIRNWMVTFFKKLSWKDFVTPENVPATVQTQNQDISKNFQSFKTKFFSFNSWVELGVIGVVVEAIFTLSLLSSLVAIVLDKQLKRKEKIKRTLYYLCTNLVGWLIRDKLLKKAKKAQEDSYQLLGPNRGIVLSNFSFAQGNYQILKEVNLRLQKNEFYAIIGPNGAGKTTLLKNIGGILEGGRGKIVLGGKHLKSISRKDFWKKVVYIPQELELQPDTPVYDFLLYSRFIFLKRTQRATPEDHLKVLEAMKKCGLEDFRYSRMGELSGGQRQKVILASIMVKDAELILLDEPTTHLDTENRLFLISFFKELKDSRKIVIANLHNFAEIAQLSSKIIAIKDGVVRRFSETNKVLESQFLNKLYDLELSEQKWERIINASLLGY
ncbi:ferrichrome ABC transporter ATPase [Mycoplasma wenyonii str. Massachusetts]|uniref:Ferrichrome ABC transporter ATPase n=1 Tax=Mycoplasma wenyonii (strain Massachusetts) TaxID=1197325 RepID=I6ZEG1_MYCWM|nr:ABC transporter ATP-binding protein [Mycoplasma wenyonii]AFN64977.1 ferrichrome ABC transporter ATPase [Mycoplasma wenyonii str. Massachusetts]